jgi:hypothetical protein
VIQSLPAFLNLPTAFQNSKRLEWKTPYNHTTDKYSTCWTNPLKVDHATATLAVAQHHNTSSKVSFITTSTECAANSCT